MLHSEAPYQPCGDLPLLHRPCLIRTLLASARRQLTIVSSCGRATSRGGALINMAQNRRPTVLKTTPPPPRAPVLRSSSSIVRGARWRAHGPHGGVVEVIRASTADLACAVVACGATQPPASPKHACDSLRPRGAPYRAPAYPGEGGEGGKHRESTGVFNSPRLSERTQGLAL